MTDLTSTSWSEIDASNNNQPPLGWPAGMFPNAVEPAARMMMGAIKRSWNRANPSYLTTQSTADSYVITPTQALAGYGLNEVWNFRANIANASTSPTLLLGSLPPQPIRKSVLGVVTALAPGDIRAQAHSAYWDGIEFILMDPSAAGIASVDVASQTSSGLLFSGGPIVAPGGAIGAKFNPTSLAVKATPTSSDSVVAMDAAAAAAGVTFLLSNILKGTAPGLVTAKASPTSSDNVLLGDAAAGGIAKIATIGQINNALASPIRQIVKVSTATFTQGTTAIPFDDSIPQSGEGDELFTVAITPLSAASLLIIDAVVYMTNTNGSVNMALAVFKDADADAIAVAAQKQGAVADAVNAVPLRAYIAASSTAARTYKLRFGSSTGATTNVNGGTARRYGGILVSSMSVTEATIP